jgi:hypothetical protein
MSERDGCDGMLAAVAAVAAVAGMLVGAAAALLQRKSGRR